MPEPRPLRVFRGPAPGGDTNSDPIPVELHGIDELVAEVLADPTSPAAIQQKATIDARVESEAPAIVGIYLQRGVLASPTDLDTLDTLAETGVYQLSSSGTYTNRPSGTSGVALLEVFGSANAIVQRISHTGVAFDWTRNKLSAGAWTAWVPALASRGTLASGTNVATLTGVTNPGLYRLNAANTYTGIPAAIAGVEATLEIQYISTSVVQRITAGGALWQRFFQGGWSDWRRYGPETVFVGATDPEPLIPSGVEYAWIKTDGNGGFVDLLVGKKA